LHRHQRAAAYKQSNALDLIALRDAVENLLRELEPGRWRRDRSSLVRINGLIRVAIALGGRSCDVRRQRHDADPLDFFRIAVETNHDRSLALLEDMSGETIGKSQRGACADARCRLGT